MHSNNRILKKRKSKKYKNRKSRNISGGASVSINSVNKGQDNLKGLLESVGDRLTELQELRKKNRSLNFKDPDEYPELDRNKKIALNLISILNDKLSKIAGLEDFKAVVIGGFAVNKYGEDSKIPYLGYLTNDIDVKICGSLDNITEEQITQIFDSIPSEYRSEQHMIDKNDLNKQKWVSLQLYKTVLLPVLRAKIISIFSESLKQLNVDTSVWPIRNTYREISKNINYFPEDYPIKLKFKGHEVMDVTFSFSDSILCNNSYATFNLNNKLVNIPLISLQALAKNLVNYTSKKNVEKNEILLKLPSWIQQLQVVSLCLNKKLRELEGPIQKIPSSSRKSTSRRKSSSKSKDSKKQSSR